MMSYHTKCNCLTHSVVSSNCEYLPEWPSSPYLHNAWGPQALVSDSEGPAVVGWKLQKECGGLSSSAHNGQSVQKYELPNILQHIFTTVQQITEFIIVKLAWTASIETWKYDPSGTGSGWLPSQANTSMNKLSIWQVRHTMWLEHMCQI